ncbi:carboxypeptidase regulatory-like domain-containing protein [bacterium]|nr:carboxypeptidase regulatory-like domain-containing protein [bacterium]
MKITSTIFVVMILGLFSCDLKDELDEAILDISGKVSHDGNAVSGAIVMLVENTGDSESFNLANGSITDNSGNYTILDVDPGEYYVVAVDDANANGEYDEGIDRIGIYGVDLTSTIPDPIPDQISVTDSDLEDIDIHSMESF